MNTSLEVFPKRMDGYDRKLEDLTKKVEAGTKNEDKKDGDDKKGKKHLRFEVRCEECVREKKKFCSHCNKCGGSGHQRKDCTEN